MITSFKKFENIQDEIGFGQDAVYANDAGEKFWGNLAAGVLPICLKTKRILLAFRSAYVNEPHTWGIFGGKLDEVQEEDDLTQVALREFREESDFNGEIELIPVFVFRKPNFEYHNFLGLVNEEFEPSLDWETEDTKWVTLDELIKIYPKHFGLKALLNEDLDKIKSYVG